MSKKVVRILSIDGGGIRGIIPAMILDWIEKRTAEIAMESVESDERPAAIESGTSGDYLPTAKLFDLIAGTSTGGILALALTKPKADPKPERMPENSAERLVQLYESEGKKIFHRSFWSRLPLIGKIVRLAKARFSADNLREVLHRYLEGAHLKDAVCDVLIPSYEVERAHP